MELWGYDIVFLKGFEVRFQYDNTKLQPSIISAPDKSKINTTVSPSNIEQYFKFEDEFVGVLEFDFDKNEIGNDSNIITAYMNLIPR